MRIKFLFATFFLLGVLTAFGQTPGNQTHKPVDPNGDTIVFKFVADNDTFYIPYLGNGDKLEELFTTIDRYKVLVANGTVRINVAGYCSSYATQSENFKSAAIRANRVKSELIVHNGIKEENFTTTIHALPYEGHKSVVVVTLRVSQIQPVVEERPQSDPKPELTPQPEPVVEEPKQEPRSTPAPDSVPLEVKKESNYDLNLRTNLLYNAMLVPNLGLEYRTNRIDVKLDAGGGYWGDEHGKVQKLWFVNPELRYYMDNARRFYVGAGGNYSKYNIYKGMVGGLFSDDTGYQGSMWNTGATAGYQLPLGHSFALDFNLGLGYNSASYDTFNVVNQTRVYKERDQSKNFFGPTQAGVSLIWKLAK